MLPKSRRLSASHVRGVLTQGTAFRTPHFLFRSVAARSFRCAVIVSKKIAPHAVDRNRMRRMVYAEIAGLLKKNCSKNAHITCTVQKKITRGVDVSGELVQGIQ